MNVDMKERRKYLEMRFRSNLLNYQISSYLYSDNPYFHIDFINGMKEVLIESKLLYLLPSSLRQEIKEFTYKVLFIVAKSHVAEECKQAGIEIRRKIKRVENTNEMMKNAIVEKVIEEEKRLRDIPDEFLLELEDVLEFYRLDLKNTRAITSPTVIKNDEPQDLFYFLATVHKLYKDCPSDIYEREDFTKQIIGKINTYNSKFSPIIEKYYTSTINLLSKSQEEREKQHKIIDLRKVLKKES